MKKLNDNEYIKVLFSMDDPKQNGSFSKFILEQFPDVYIFKEPSSFNNVICHLDPNKHIFICIHIGGGDLAKQKKTEKDKYYETAENVYLTFFQKYYPKALFILGSRSATDEILIKKGYKYSNPSKITLEYFGNINIHDQLVKDVLGVKSISGHIQTIDKICCNFSKIVNQLKIRRKDSGTTRNTIEIKDEYDVQDLLHSLLKIHFNDVRVEEWTPSKGGNSQKRIDLYLPNENIFIETKITKTSKNTQLNDKSLIKAIIEDTGSFDSHPGLNYLYYFVYDPDQILNNPNAIMKDYSNKHQVRNTESEIMKEYEVLIKIYN